MKFTPVDLPINYGKIEAVKWIRETIGYSKPDAMARWDEMIWYHDWVSTKECFRFYFRNPEHATLFALRWS